MHVFVPDDMAERVWEIAKGLPWDAPNEARLPAPSVVVEIGGGSCLFVQEGLEVRFHVLTGGIGHVASIERGECDIRYTGKAGPLDGWREKVAAQTVIVMDLIFSFMAEPRFIRQTAFSRARRKTESRQYGGALPNTWVKIGWTIGASTTTKIDRAGSAPIRAFHMVRGHWRNYKDQKTPKGERRPGRPGWWVWIEAFYSGNPALGEIKHHYMPRIEDPGRSSRLVHANVAARIAGSARKIQP